MTRDEAARIVVRELDRVREDDPRLRAIEEDERSRQATRNFQRARNIEGGRDAACCMLAFAIICIVTALGFLVRNAFTL